MRGEEIYTDLKAGQVARCIRCLESMQEQGVKRKRGANGSRSIKNGRKPYEDEDESEEGDDDIPEAGVMKVDTPGNPPYTRTTLIAANSPISPFSERISLRPSMTGLSSMIVILLIWSL